MSYKELFPHYGNPASPADIGVKTYILRPEYLREAKDIAWYDKQAADAIQEMQTTIERLQDYRRALAARYGELETMPYTLRLELERRPMYDGHKVYYVRLIKRYEDGSEVTELNETYTGKERRAAIDRYEELRRSRPGIETVKDIERRQWER